MSKNRLFSLLVVIGLVAVAALTAREAYATSLVVQQAKEAQGIQRGHDAEAARWAALAKHYAKGVQGIHRSRDPEAARWAAQAEYYAKEVQGIQRSRDAEAARWAALAEYSKKLGPPGSENPSHLSLSSLISAARYTGEALQEYERTGNRKALPICISAETLAELPPVIGNNDWMSIVPVCGQ